jgi:hypothetical protein
LIATVHDGPEFTEIVGFMNDAGFVLFDIVAAPLDLALAQMDAVFVPKTSPRRQMGPPGTVNPKLASFGF